MDGSAAHCVRSAAGHRPTPKFLGDLNNSSDNALWGEACLAPLPLTYYACIMHAVQQQKRAPRRRRTTRPTERPKRKIPKPEEEAEGVGCKSGT